MTATVALAIAVLAPTALPEAAVAGCGGADVNPNDVRLRVVREATLCLINEQRRSSGRKRLKSNAQLREAASLHARAMVRKGFFAHDSPSGDTVTDRIRDTGYLDGSRSWAVGENIGWGAWSLATPGAIMRAWMASPGHRANILARDFRHIGVGVVRGTGFKGFSLAATYVTDFGRR